MISHKISGQKSASLRATALFLAVVAISLAPARAQDDRLVTNPPLEQAFPLESKFGDIKLKFPVLLNAQTIVGPDATLRFIYIDSGATARPPGGGLHPHAEAGSGGGDGPAAQDPTAGGSVPNAPPHDPLNPDKELKELHSEIWHDIDTFQQALHSANDLGTMFVYAQPGDKKPRSALLAPPGGMLLGEVDGHVEVLALTDDSRAATAGLQPGDQILAADGKPVTSLREFSTLYLAIAARTRKESKPYSLQVARPGQSDPVTIQVGAPPSLMHLM